MCGIIASPGQADLGAAITALGHRGPDGAAQAAVAGVSLGHTRLAIRDPRPRSDQPFTDGPVTVTYNGEIFNTGRLRGLVEAADPERGWVTTGDTEVLAALLAVLGPAVLGEVDGMFAVAWGDERTPGVLHVARDRFGEVPLHLHRSGAAASEVKALAALGLPAGRGDWADVPPGWHLEARAGGGVAGTQFATVTAEAAQVSAEEARAGLAARLGEAVSRRAVSDVPVCCLLSGGIDSAVIALELSRVYPDLVCYTAVMDTRSPDLRAARETAARLGVKLVEVTVPPPTADDLASVVACIEMPYKAQVEIGWPCLALAGAMSGDGFKVTYSGEGSDELWASYKFAYHAVAAKGWHAARRDLICGQARKNFPRVNKSFMSCGVEARLPFLDPDVVAWALSLPHDVVAARPHAGPSKRKAILQDAYAGKLPPRVISRPRLAFQDGLGIREQIAGVLADPRRFYAAEYRRRYG